jgi:hypothetical protein
MTQSFFETESAHSNVMYWWHGVIVDDKYWAGCGEADVSNEHSKLHFADKMQSAPKKGWGKRYKVAVVGRHYAVKGKPEEADLLEMAEVVYPVTAGTGLGGTKQTAALRQGAHVIGFYADGKEGRNPVIIGAFGINEQNEPSIAQEDPNNFYQLRTANKGQCGEKLKPVPEKDQNLEKDKKPIESIASPLQASQAHKTKVEDGNVLEPIYKPTRCEQPADIIRNIKLLLNKLSYYVNLAKRGASDLVSSIDGIIKSVTRAISGLTNTLLDRARGYLMNLINNGIKDVMNFLPPFFRPNFNQNAQGAVNGLGCAFNKIKDKVLGIVQDLAKQFIDNYVNAPLCAATSFLGSLLGNILGEINGAVDKAVNKINEIIKIAGGFADKALSVLDLALDVLGFFECDTNEKKCPDTVQWSFWNGPKEIQTQVEEAVSRKVKNIIDEVETALPGSGDGASSNPCNSRQVPCGPPQVQIIGGGGSGAKANAVVSATGAILGLDFSAFGSGYTYEPQIRVVDSCGTGGGAVFQPIMQPTGTSNQFNEPILNLVGAIPIDSGTQYLPAPNGTTGGAGFIFSQPGDTILFKTGTTQIINGKEVKGTGYEVYPCQTTFNVVNGDEIYLPSGTVAEIFDQEGNVLQTLNGLGQVTKLDVRATGTLTAPCNPDNIINPVLIEIPLSTGDTQLTPITTQSKPVSYPVVPVIKEVFVKSPGFGYTENDTISIQNNKGAELEFVVNDAGEVTEVKVINGGIGFTDVPFIFINSKTGFNFEAVAVFDFIPLSEIDLNNITPPPGAKLISVIDCVGKVLPEQEFDRVPTN